MPDYRRIPDGCTVEYAGSPGIRNEVVVSHPEVELEFLRPRNQFRETGGTVEIDVENDARASHLLDRYEVHADMPDEGHARYEVHPSDLLDIQDTDLPTADGTGVGPSESTLISRRDEMDSIEWDPVSSDVVGFTYGLEIEQPQRRLPPAVRDGPFEWHQDQSGPWETAVGPVGDVSELLDEVAVGTTDIAPGWEWTAADGSAGCGSHIHVALDPSIAPELSPSERTTAWTIAYNTAVTLVPFLTPFFCHNWQAGFRNGHHRLTSGIRGPEYWARPQTGRVSQDTMGRWLKQGYDREYMAVTFHGPRSEREAAMSRERFAKPHTIEIRLNDAHPAFAGTGAQVLGVLMSAAIGRGLSPKLDGDDSQLRAAYDRSYIPYGTTDDVDETFIGGLRTPISKLIHSRFENTAVRQFDFEDDREIPTHNTRIYESVFDVTKDLIGAARDVAGEAGRPAFGRAGERVLSLVESSHPDHSPSCNQLACWSVGDERFEWDTAPGWL